MSPVLVRRLSQTIRAGNGIFATALYPSTSCLEYYYTIRTTTCKKTFSSTNATTAGIQLHYDWAHPPKHNKDNDKQYDHVVVFLHGLLGNGKNLRTPARKLCEISNQHGLLLDVRGHGNSKLPGSGERSSFAACVDDLNVTLQSIPQISNDKTKITLVGHSLGGRISLQYAFNAVDKQPRHNIHRVWLLDTVPGQANDSVERVVRAVTELSSQSTAITDRKQLVQQLTGEPYKIDTGTAQWLASSLQKSTANNSKTLEFGFDLHVVNDLLADFQSQDFMAMLHHVVSNGVRVDLVRGGKNKGWTELSLQPLNELKQQYADTFGMHLLPKAGHWVHVDDLPGLLEVMNAGF